MSARVNAGLSMRAAISAMRARSSAPRCAGAPSRRAPAKCASRSSAQAARIGAPLLLELLPGQRLGFGGAGGLLRGRQLRGGGLAVDDHQVVLGPLPQPGGALRPRFDAVLVDAGDLGHPGVRIDRVPLESTFGVQLMTQHGLVDDPGGFGFVVQRFGVDANQLTVCAGLAIGHDDVGVQVRVAASRRFVLVGDRHQPGQAL